MNCKFCEKDIEAVDPVFQEHLCGPCGAAMRYGVRWGMGLVVSELSSINYFHEEWIARVCDHVDKPPCKDCAEMNR